jgi:hypothetical protein
MKVLLANNWFSPIGIRFRKSDGADDLRDIPDSLQPVLPKSAKVIEGGPVIELADISSADEGTLKELDLARAEADALRKANEQAQERLQQMEDQLVASNAAIKKLEGDQNDGEAEEQVETPVDPKPEPDEPSEGEKEQPVAQEPVKEEKKQGKKKKVAKKK